MKRHAALVALSHDHHHALVAARRLRAAAADVDPEPARATFNHFFAAVTVPHFREEEEALFPLVADREEARLLLVRALLEHQRLHALAARLESSADARPLMAETADLLERHVRFEERELFPLIERLAGLALEDGLRRLEPSSGPVWGQASEDLNATLLAWGRDSGPPEHVNDHRDVLIFVVEGSATVAIDDDDRALAAGDALIIPKGGARKITAGRGGVRYLSVHVPRPPLQIEPLGGRPESE